MIDFPVPGRGRFRLEHLVLDLNGTLALDGELVAGVPERLRTLQDRLSVHLLTADTFGRLAQIEPVLGFPATRISTSNEKTMYVRALDPQSVVAVGNGANDAGMLSEACLGIVVLGPEGLALHAMEAADVVVPDINSALDLLLNPKRLVATLRL